MIEIPVEAPLTEFLHRKAVVKGIPLNGTFELTPCCNMACKMCYVRMTRQQQEAIRPLRSVEKWLELGRRAKEAGMFYLLLTGGEPFLHPQFREILTRLHQMGLVISINSNGTLIDEKVIAWLKETPPVRINITLYGASDETYTRLCGNPKGFTQVTKAIRLLREAGITVKINCSVTPYNVCDLQQIFAFAKQEKLIVQATSYMFPPVRRDENLVGTNDRFSPEDAAYYAACIGCLMNGEEEFLYRMEHGLLPGIHGEAGEDCPDVAEGEGIRCRAGRCSFWVTWEGTVLPCGMFPMQGAPNAFEQPFSEAWKSVKETAAAIRLPKTCAGCSHKEDCKPCAAMVYTESGEFSKVPEYRCRMTKAYYDGCQRLEQKLKEKHSQP